MATPKIRAANAASTSALAPELPKKGCLKDGEEYEISLVKSENLSSRAQDAIFELFDENMLALQSTSSFPYTEQSKREELFDSDARYILIRSTSAQSPSSSSPIIQTIKSLTGTGGGQRKSIGSGKGDKKGKGKAVNEVDFEYEDLLGFCGFRSDTEETLISRDAEVVYCYEVQLSSKCRGLGLGRILLNILEDIGKRRSLDKVMLTCLKSNESALAFYTRQGYTPDEIDPTRMEEEESGDESDGGDDDDGADEEVDYRILSKSLKGI